MEIRLKELCQKKRNYSKRFSFKIGGYRNDIEPRGKREYIFAVIGTYRRGPWR